MDPVSILVGMVAGSAVTLINVLAVGHFAERRRGRAIEKKALGPA